MQQPRRRTWMRAKSKCGAGPSAAATGCVVGGKQRGSQRNRIPEQPKRTGKDSRDKGVESDRLVPIRGF